MTPTQKLEALIEARETLTQEKWINIKAQLPDSALVREFYLDAVSFAATDAKAVLERLRRLEGALRYYADEDTWDKICIDLDYGRDIRRISLTGKARAALAEGE